MLVGYGRSALSPGTSPVCQEIRLGNIKSTGRIYGNAPGARKHGLSRREAVLVRRGTRTGATRNGADHTIRRDFAHQFVILNGVILKDVNVIGAVDEEIPEVLYLGWVLIAPGKSI